jgi:hypothetical protein
MIRPITLSASGQFNVVDDANVVVSGSSCKYVY